MRRLLLILLFVSTGASAVSAQDASFRARIGGRPTAVSAPPIVVGAALVVTEKTADASTANATSYASTAFTLTTNTLGLCAVISSDSDDGPDIPTLAQAGQTYVQLQTVVTPANSMRVTWFRTLGAGAASAVATATFDDAQGGAFLRCVQVANVPTSGTQGSGAIARAIALSEEDAGASFAATLTLSFPARDSQSAVISAYVVDDLCTVIAAEPGYTLGTAASFSTPSRTSVLSYVVGGADTEVSVDVSSCPVQGKVSWAGVAIEVIPDSTTDLTDPIVDFAPESPVTGGENYVFSGLSLDNDDVEEVRWANPSCAPTSGIATGTETWMASCDLTCSGGGTANVFTIEAEDPTGNVGTAQRTVVCFSVDTIDPTLSIQLPTTSPTYSTAQPVLTVSGMATDETGFGTVGVACAACASVGSTTGTTDWSANLTLTCSASPGTANTIIVTATDAASNATVRQLVATCTTSDVTVPVITVTTNGGSNFSVTTPTQLVSGTASDNVGLQNVTGACSTCSPQTWTVNGPTNWSFEPALGIGANVITHTARDLSGNTATDSITITRAPTVAITNGSCGPAEDNTVYTGCTLTASGGDETYTWVEVGTTLATDPECAGVTFADVGNTGVFGGTPTEPGVCGPVTVRVTDGAAATTTKEFTITVAVEDAIEGPHDYFESLKALPEHHLDYSLRDQTQLNGIVDDAVATNFSYNFAGDTHQQRQDAAKYVYTPTERVDPCIFQGKVRVIGAPGTVILRDMVMTRASDGKTYRILNPVTLPASETGSSSMITDAQALGQGPSFYAAVGEAFDDTPPIAGWTSTTVTTAIHCQDSESIFNAQQLKMPVGISAGSVLITWDFYFGPEWRFNSGTLKAYKLWQLRLGAGSGTQWWTSCMQISVRSPTDTSEIGKSFDALRPDQPYPNGLITRENPLTPAGVGALQDEIVPYRHSMWTRWWMEIKLYQPPEAFTEWNNAYGVTVQANPNDAQGRWHMISLWVASETSDPVRLVYKVPMQWPTGVPGPVGRFIMEMNTSTKAGAITGDLVAWARNVAILLDYNLPATTTPETDTTIFKRPVR